MDAVAAVDLEDGWRVDQSRVPPGDSRRRALVQDRRSLGHVPGQCASSVVFISSIWVSAYCDSFQSLMAMELLLIWGRRRADDLQHRSASAGGVGLWLDREAEGPRVLAVIVLFSRVLSAIRSSSVSFKDVSVFIPVFVLYFHG